MDKIKEAVQVIQRAERELRELLAKAATNGRYDEINWLSDLARDISKLAARADGPLGSDGSPDAIDTIPPAKVNSEPAGNRHSRQGESRKQSYPRFMRDGDVVVKLGWSKSAKAEYEHKAPKSVLVQLVSELNKVAATKKRFAMDDVLPLKDPTSRSEIPSYQAYLCLAWLREAGIVTQHGRQGYSVPKKNIADARVEEIWNQLSSR